VGLVKSLGAHEVIDYTKEDFTRRGRAYDVTFDAAGKCPTSRGKLVLKQGGHFTSVRNSPKLEAQDLETLKDLIEAGKLTPVIDRRYPLEQIADAHRYVELGHKSGNVVVTVPHGGVR
jgi:NADPH:quinone reductase-like Zn-dependent oxidoreductase